MNRKSIALALLFLLMSVACQKEDLLKTTQSENELEKSLVTLSAINPIGLNARIDGDIKDMIASLNESLLAYDLQIEKVEYLGAELEGATVFFKDTGNKRLLSDYLPNDPRNGTGTAVPYVIDGTELGTSSGMSDAATVNAIVNAMNTWDAVTCSSGLSIPGLGVAGFDIGYVQFLLGYGGIAGFFPGTIAHSGILPGSFFDIIEPGGSSFILGVTFTFVWTEDLNQDGKPEVAFKEIYINDNFNWQDAPDDVLGNGIYDFETVVLHETGHGLCQAHFGMAFFTRNGIIHFAPAALMNAGYSVARREVTETDEAGHCSNWALWPNK